MKAIQPTYATLALDACAKLNLYLGIEPLIIAGRHQLRSVFATIALHDTLRFSYLPADKDATSKQSASTLALKITTWADPSIALLAIADKDNIITKAAAAFEEAFTAAYARPLPMTLLEVVLEKRIPAEAGLGGGSADAAATIKALARFCGLSLEHDAGFLQEIASKVGADVPFFLTGGCALMAGAGDLLERCLPAPNPPLPIALVKPATGVSTKAAYQCFDAAPTPAAPLEPLLAALAASQALLQSEAPTRLEAVSRALANNLEPAAQTLLPETADLIKSLSAQSGVLTARLCGSGSTVFAVCASPGDAQRVAQSFAERGYWSQATQTM